MIYSTEKLYFEDGKYDGIYGGSEVYIPSIDQTFRVNKSVRTFNIKVTVIVRKGKAVVEFKDDQN